MSFKAALVGALAATCVSTASGAVIPVGLYQLGNHPGADHDPPPYGLRFDELANVTAGLDIFTLSFDAADGADVQMEYDGTTIHIFGTAFGGRDIGADYADDGFKGFYGIDFTYDVGVGPSPNDDDIQVTAAMGSNTGVLTLPDNSTINFFDKPNNSGFTFRLGDTGDDQGYEGHDGISGWGWVDSDEVPDAGNGFRDWVFTAELIPAPASLLAFAPMGVFGLRRRR